VNYTYALAGTHSGAALMIFHFDDNAAAIRTLKANGVKILDHEAFDILEAAN
jgi:hypothetical protein